MEPLKLKSLSNEPMLSPPSVDRSPTTTGELPMLTPSMYNCEPEEPL